MPDDIDKFTMSIMMGQTKAVGMGSRQQVDVLAFVTSLVRDSTHHTFASAQVELSVKIRVYLSESIDQNPTGYSSFLMHHVHHLSGFFSLGFHSG